MRILICDDDKTICTVINGFLDREFSNCDVRKVYTGKSCIEEASSFYPDIIILDIRLPDILGYTVCEQIRDTDINTGILMLTGYASNDEVKQRSLQAGADAFLIKPIDRCHLVSQINLVLLKTKYKSSNNNLNELKNLTRRLCKGRE